MYMQKPPVRGSDPETAIAIPEQPFCREKPPGAWKRIRLGFPVNELSDSAAHREQQCAFIVFDQRERWVWQRIEFRRTGLHRHSPAADSAQRLPAPSS